MSRKNQKKHPDADSKNAASADTDDLFKIDKLLTTASELMKHQPGLDRSAFEQLRQLRVRIRQAQSTIALANPDAVPKKAPSLWKDRDDKTENPISFLKRIYGSWLSKGLIRPDIKRLDPQLYNAIYNLQNPAEELDRIGLPTKKRLNDLKLEAAGKLSRPSRTSKIYELSPAERERARLFNVARRRKQRAQEL
jgi:hypothetical protein